MNKEFLVEKYRLYGCVGFIVYLCQKILSRILHIKLEVMFLYAHDLPTKCYSEDVQFKTKRMSFVDFQKNSASDILQFSEWEMRKIKRALTLRKNIAVGIYYEDVLVAYGLIDYKKFVLLSRKLNESDVYFWDDYVNPNWRGQRIHELLYKSRANLAIMVSKKRVLSYVDFYNKASIRAHEHEGFKRIQTFINFRFRKFHYCSFKYPG